MSFGTEGSWSGLSYETEYHYNVNDHVNDREVAGQEKSGNSIRYPFPWNIMLILFYTCYIQDTLMITAWKNVAYSISEPKKATLEYFFSRSNY